MFNSKSANSTPLKKDDLDGDQIGDFRPILNVSTSSRLFSHTIRTLQLDKLVHNKYPTGHVRVSSYRLVNTSLSLDVNRRNQCCF